ncbi:MAG: peptide ABC transporter substrate-binding protein [Gammaproteobacteria bacterium]|nr:peptide ABC transporter substrate-binding protein [Gammaproteobacteria bacterium]
MAGFRGVGAPTGATGRRSRRSALLLLFVVTAPALAGTSIHRTSGAEPPSLDPTQGSGSMAAPMLSDMVEGLVGRGPSKKPEPASAGSWAVSPDGLVWTFRLRPGLQWSDGTRLTAEDFVYSYRRLLDPASAASNAGLFLALKNARRIIQKQMPPDALGVRAPDSRTVVMELEYPVPYFLQILTNTQAVPVPRHVIEKLGRDWTRPGSLVSNGPYVLAERVPQSYVKLVKNPRYRDAGSVRIDEVFWHPTQDLGAAFRRFRAGEMDVVLNVAPDDLGWIRENQPDALHTGPIHATYLLVLNVARKPLDDVRVRRALSLAIDRDAIANQLLKTGVRPAWSFVSPGIGGYPGLTTPEEGMPKAKRLAEARRLLDEAGYGPDNPLTLPLVYDTQEENRKIMVAIGGMWQAVGVRAEISNVEFGALLGALRSKNYAVVRSSTFSLYDDPMAFLQQFGSQSPTNWAGWTNPRYDQLLMQSNAAPEAAADGVTRTKLLQDAEALLNGEQPVIPIYYYQGKALVAPRVKGWWDGAIGTPPSRFLSVE